MKGYVKQLLSLCLCFAVLTGCSSESSQKPITSAGNSSEAESETQTAVKDTAGTTVEEQVIFDANDVVITVTGYEEDQLFGDELKLLIENNGSSDVGIGCDALIVNDYMIYDLFSATVAAGKKSNETMDLMTSQLEAAGIENVGQIEIYFHLYDPDTYMTTYTADKAVVQTNYYADMDSTPNDAGKELYNANGIRIVGKYVDSDSFWGQSIVLYLENNTDQKIIVSVEDLSVNGYMIDGYLYSELYPHKKAVDDITLFESDLTENNIESVDDIELKFHIYDSDTYNDIANTDVISFSTK